MYRFWADFHAVVGRGGIPAGGEVTSSDEDLENDPIANTAVRIITVEKLSKRHGEHRVDASSAVSLSAVA